jgi:hypothetical protein
MSVWERKQFQESPVGAPDRFIAWCKQEQASIEQQLELLQAGKVRTGEDIGAGWIDTTDESIERAKGRLIELNDLLTDAGAATVVKPSAL